MLHWFISYEYPLTVFSKIEKGLFELLFFNIYILPSILSSIIQPASK